MAIKTVGVLGCGLMGAGVAQVSAAAGFKTIVLEVNGDILQKGLGRIEDALATFQQLRQRDQDYVPMYLMCGTMLIEAGRRDDAKDWLGAGLIAARKKGDTHAAGEIEGALAGL